jgi:predicted TIM-barrel fold metal-dependent hydrolase
MMPVDPALRNLPLRDFRPRPSLRVEEHHVARSRFPAIDVHNHLGRWLSEDGAWTSSDVGDLIALMDACNVTSIVNLDGKWGDELEANLDRYDRAHPGRFATFARWDRELFPREDWVQLAAGVADSARRGARGLKVWKDLGLHLRDAAGALVMPDDRRLDPVWDAVATAQIPVTIHVVDPVAFFEPLDARNERLEELLENPDWWFGDRSRFPLFETIIGSLEALIARRTDVTWIGAHALCVAEDVAWIGRMLDTYPNVHADVAARIAELGRVPRATRELVMRHPDRFLFGTDAFPPDGDVYAAHRRFFETADEHFAYDSDPEEVPGQGRWTISGIDLPLDVLERVYRTNAKRLLGF